FGWEDPGLAFDVALHWGTLAAVLAVFWRDWIRLISAGLLGKGSDADKRVFWGLVVSAVPAAIVGKLLDKWAEENLRAPLFIAAAVVGVAVIRWMLAWLRTRTYLPFVVYRLLVAALVVALWLSGKR